MSTDTQPLHVKENLTLQQGMDPPPKKTFSGYLCLKILVVVYSFILFAIGMLLVGVGYWIESEKRSYDSINDFVKSPAIIAIAVGALMIITAFFGLFGALREHLCFLKTFLALIVLIFIAQVIIGIIAFVYREETEVILIDQIKSSIEKYTENENIKESVDRIQSKFQCCGIETALDWDINANYSCNSTDPEACSVPESCCRVHKAGCGLEVRKGITKLAKLKAGIYKQGCYQTLQIYIQKHLDSVGATALGLAIPQILGIFLVYITTQKVYDRKWLFRYSDRGYE